MPKPQPTDVSLKKMQKYVEHYIHKSGTFLHPDPSITDSVVQGLAQNMDELGKPLCPCNFYPDKKAEAQKRTWICACDEMKEYKYCHCLLFVAENGLPITEYLPEDHEGRTSYGVVKDPMPEKGREATRVQHPHR
ncbi:MAG: ferredoxin:thioredoxin reductase [Rhizobacter sp.]|nr:ferredoxin:thioredoxin reductase [Chlorobiales bacterium]